DFRTWTCRYARLSCSRSSDSLFPVNENLAEGDEPVKVEVERKMRAGDRSDVVVVEREREAGFGRTRDQPGARGANADPQVRGVTGCHSRDLDQTAPATFSGRP